MKSYYHAHESAYQQIKAKGFVGWGNAKELARQQKLEIEFIVGDILDLNSFGRKFDFIYDSHFLHCIVFEEDRKRVFEGIKSVLSMMNISCGTKQNNQVIGGLLKSTGNIGVRNEEFIL